MRADPCLPNVAVIDLPYHQERWYLLRPLCLSRRRRCIACRCSWRVCRVAAQRRWAWKHWQYTRSLKHRWGETLQSPDRTRVPVCVYAGVCVSSHPVLPCSACKLGMQASHSAVFVSALAQVCVSCSRPQVCLLETQLLHVSSRARTLECQLLTAEAERTRTQVRVPALGH